jgi:hypothetical protein
MVDEQQELEEDQDEVMDDEVFDDDAKDEDYIAPEEEEPADDQDEEPVEEEVAKEVEELVKSSPERKEKDVPKTTPFTFGTATSNQPLQPFTFSATIKSSTSMVMDDQVPKIQPFNFGKKEDEKPKEPEMSEIQPSTSFNPPKSTSAINASETKSVFRFGLPSTPSTFKPIVPELSATPAGALRKEFKFGLPSKPEESAPKPEEKEPPPLSKVPRQSLRSSSPAKRTADEDEEVKPPSPKKWQRSISPRKNSPEKQSEPLVGDTIEVQHLPQTTLSFDAKPSTATEQSKSFSFGATPSEPKDSTDTSKSFSFGVKKDYTWTPDKPIKFDTPPTAKPSSSSTFAFGQQQQPFMFGGLSTPVPSAPKFGSFGSSPSGFGAFGGSSVSFTSPNLGFSFGQATKPEENKPETQSEPEIQDSAAAEDEENPPTIPIEEIPTAGEEDEETVFSSRAKLIQRLSTKERQLEIEKRGGNPNDVKMDRDYGVGVVRVNVHKETSKGRILFRLEGSGRVVLVLSPPNTASFQN